MQLVAHLTQEQEVLYPVWSLTFVSLSTDARKMVVSYRQNYVHFILVNHLGCRSLPRNSLIRLIDSSDMTIAVYCGCKATKFLVGWLFGA